MLESSVTEIAVAAVTVAVGAAFYFGAPKPSADGTVQPDQEQTSTKATSTSKKSGKKNKKKSLPGNIVRATSGEDTAAEESIPLKQQSQPQIQAQPPQPQPKEKEVTPKPEFPPTSSTAAKKKKKKSKAPVSGIETTLAQSQAQPSASAYESSSANDGAWTRVETRRKTDKSAAVLSDGLTTSVTGTEDEAEEQVKQPTLAERLLPAGRKTGVEDMLETPQYPDVARVMRVKPADEQQPAPGYSWGDYEDAEENKVISMDDEETDEGGWGVVKSRKPKRSQTVTQTSGQAKSSTSDSSSLTKKQRQNAAKRDASKSAKADAEEDRLAKLQAHKRALERERIAQAYAKPASGKGKASGGMTASVNEKGSLVWD
ncbi:hypothetical protein RSOLAG1IB_07656 [Rhizoctonia solani AG-1 IB]|uniref:Uncharacterized protein n=1 Tax=Thanatephorus cucumeris (strain AG1-IB / isolate 7/3/14) TaxID=1108050 RepID=M5BPR6_THACB|nr:hypothetical protein BN14_03083 [Rhizoctonia solani AG-1 IB]CEL56240.1 hypothetical protein RSOLAG1IB_07656 [Rhizoctonia solani AG-1 IB]